MMVFALQKHAIATGWNVALNSLTNWEAQSVNGIYFVGLRSWGNYRAGVSRLLSTGMTYIAGEPSTAWNTLLWHIHYRYIQTTYCNSAFSGKVTIYTITTTPSTYARFNAILTIPQLSEIDWVGRKTRAVQLQLTRLEAL
jgi:hypothetical protein